MTELNEQTENFLAHYGVKGMRWGHRKTSDVGSGGSLGKPGKLTFKERRAEKKEFYLNKADDVVKTAVNDPEALIKTRGANNIPMILTGKEFIDHLEKGGYMDVYMTEIYAQKDPNQDGAYVLKENERYVRSDKKKT